MFAQLVDALPQSRDFMLGHAVRLGELTDTLLRGVAGVGEVSDMLDGDGVRLGELAEPPLDVIA